MLPRANKTQMIRFLRDQGYSVSQTKQAKFSKEKDAFWLDYMDDNENWHQAFYSVHRGDPIFSVDHNFIDITLEEMIEHGMYRLKSRTDG